jgi:hypothetical protein
MPLDKFIVFFLRGRRGQVHCILVLYLLEKINCYDFAYNWIKLCGPFVYLLRWWAILHFYHSSFIFCPAWQNFHEYNMHDWRSIILHCVRLDKYCSIQLKYVINHVCTSHLQNKCIQERGTTCKLNMSYNIDAQINQIW